MAGDQGFWRSESRTRDQRAEPRTSVMKTPKAKLIIIQDQVFRQIGIMNKSITDQFLVDFLRNLVTLRSDGLQFRKVGTP